MSKINILEPIHNGSGVIYYQGFVNGSYIHFLGYNKLTKREIKVKLLDKYNSMNIEVEYGR